MFISTCIVYMYNKTCFFGCLFKKHTLVLNKLGIQLIQFNSFLVYTTFGIKCL